MLQRGTGSRYIGEEAGKRRAAVLCAAAEAFVPARKRESYIIFRKPEGGRVSAGGSASATPARRDTKIGDKRER